MTKTKRKKQTRHNRIQIYVNDNTNKLLKQAAALQRRRISNFVEIILDEHCAKIIAAMSFEEK